MAASTALVIAEIVQNVLEHVHDRHNLASCVRVNSLWQSEGLGILWREAPPLQDMIQLSARNQLTKYLPYIRRQEIGYHLTDDAHDVAALLRSGVLRSTRTVELKLQLPLLIASNPIMESILQRNLRILDIGEGRWGDSLLDMVQQNAPLLQALAFANRVPELMSDLRTKEFLYKMPSLAYADDLIDSIADIADIFDHLSRRENLLCLSIFGDRADALEKRLNHGPAPFLSIRTLKLRVDPEQNPWIKEFLGGLSKLEVLTIAWDGMMRDLAFTLGNCPTLRQLTCLYWQAPPSRQWTGYDAESFAAIGKACPELRLFYIEPNVFSPEPSTEVVIEAEDISEIGRNFPNLEVLVLPVTLTLCGPTFDALHHGFPKLRILRVISMDLDFTDIAPDIPPPHPTSEFPNPKDDDDAPAPAPSPLRLERLGASRTNLFLTRDSGGGGGQPGGPQDSAISTLTRLMPSLRAAAFASVDDIQRAALARLDGALEPRLRLPERRSETVRERIFEEIYRAGLRVGPVVGDVDVDGAVGGMGKLGFWP